MIRSLLAVLVLGLSLPATAEIRHELNAKRADWWESKVAYPEYSAKGPAPKMLNQMVKEQAKSMHEEFLAMARRDMPEIKEMGSAGEYWQEVDYTVGFSSSSLATMHWSIYNYTAGAHGSAWYEPVNIGWKEGKYQRLKLEDLFNDGVDSVSQIRMALLPLLMKTERPNNIKEGYSTDIDPGDYESFVITKKGLLYLFGHYAIGPYAVGTFEVLVPYDDIIGLDPTGPLAPVLAPKG